MNDTSELSNMRNSEKRKVKRSFPRPKASNILGLDQESPSFTNNTHTTVGHRDKIGKDHGY